MTLPSFDEIVVPNDQTEARGEHLARFIELVGNAYPNKFDRSSLSGNEDTISNLKAFGPVAAAAKEMADVRATLEPGTRPPAELKDKLNETLKELGGVRIAGRVATPIRGNFVHLTDGREKLQIYAKKGQFTLARNDGGADREPETAWEAWQILDHGDLIGVEGYLFVTNTGEVSVHVERLTFLSKALSPMPDKVHGIEDAEIKQRKRYLDLIASSLRVEMAGEKHELSTRETFEVRAKTISSIRHFLEDNGYIEVETPMLTPKATGAAAKPFKTHHNALDIALYARIAPELYLKRLLVGGFEKVYELNRNFRNEGISYKHNPEFTMLEFYCAYMNVNGMMDFCEKLIQKSVMKATGGLVVEYEGKKINFSKFERIAMRDAIIRHFPERWKLQDQDIPQDLSDPLRLSKFTQYVRRVFIAETDGSLSQHSQSYPLAKQRIWEGVDKLMQTEHESGGEIEQLFDIVVEPNLIQPTFIIDYPKSISPLSKASPEDPQIAERFELFINGMEVANGFSELNDPREQYERFVDQAEARERGDDEAMVLDEDYVRALSYGMPPAAGIGIGIDRLVMLLTNKHSIRDVILFPHMRPERKQEAESTEDDE
ncbi:MAG: Lysine--tRNA ligase [Pyrinomonadaceae bacterium]|nr:Lysine--tRNA ligase [Pyrinomonadaceae bacterium]